MEYSFEEYEQQQKSISDVIKNSTNFKKSKGVELMHVDSNISIIYTDGGAHNKGDGEFARAGIGIYSPPESCDIALGYFIGDDISSNMAEYEAIIAALKICLFLGKKCIHLRSDSQLVVRHIEKECMGRKGYDCNDQKLIRRLMVVKELVNKFDYFEIENISRVFNKQADFLVRKATSIGKLYDLPIGWEASYMHYGIGDIGL